MKTIGTACSRRRTLTTLISGMAGVLLATSSFCAHAQAGYPDRQLHFIVPQAAGGTGDTVSRIVAQKLSTRLGQQVIVENKAGAGGTVGSATVAKAKPDGYSLVLASSGYATWKLMFPGMTFNPDTELTPVAMFGSLPFAVLVRPDSRFRNLADFVAYAKTNPGKVNYASAGLGAASHLLTAWLAAEAGLDLTHVPYSSTAPALTALLGGQVDIYLDPVATSAPQVAAGKLRVLATTGATRSKVMPDVPTIAESGYPVKGSVWLALMTTGGTPAPVVERLNREVRAVLQDPETRDALQSRGVEVDIMTADEFRSFVANEVRVWSKLVRDNNIKPQ